MANGPYDIDLTLNAPHAVDQSTVNNPFGVAEMERILRWPDRDAAIAAAAIVQPDQQRQRLALAVAAGGVHGGKLVGSHGLRRLAAGRCGLHLPETGESQHPVDIIYAKIAKNGVATRQPQFALRRNFCPGNCCKG